MKFFISFVAFFSIGAAQAAVQCTDEVRFDEYQYVELSNGDTAELLLNGVGLREFPIIFFNVDVFYAALYLEDLNKDGEKIIDSDQIKRTVVHALRFISKEDLIENWDEEFERLCEDQCDELRPYHEQRLSHVRDVNTNERLFLTHHSDRLELFGEYADGTTEKAEPIMSGDYSDLILRSFIGPEPNNDELKQGMLGNEQICQ